MITNKRNKRSRMELNYREQSVSLQQIFCIGAFAMQTKCSANCIVPIYLLWTSKFYFNVKLYLLHRINRNVLNKHTISPNQRTSIEHTTLHNIDKIQSTCPTTIRAHCWDRNTCDQYRGWRLTDIIKASIITRTRGVSLYPRGIFNFILLKLECIFECGDSRHLYKCEGRKSAVQCHFHSFHITSLIKMRFAGERASVTRLLGARGGKIIDSLLASECECLTSVKLLKGWSGHVELK